MCIHGHASCNTAGGGTGALCVSLKTARTKREPRTPIACRTVTWQPVPEACDTLSAAHPNPTCEQEPKTLAKTMPVVHRHTQPLPSRFRHTLTALPSIHKTALASSSPTHPPAHPHTCPTHLRDYVPIHDPEVVAEQHCAAGDEGQGAVQRPQEGGARGRHRHRRQDVVGALRPQRLQGAGRWLGGWVVLGGGWVAEERGCVCTIARMACAGAAARAFALCCAVL